MDVNALWLFGAAIAGSTIKPVVDYLAGRDKSDLDQLQIALQSVKDSNERVEKLEGKIAGQARELDQLRRQLAAIEGQRDRLQASYQDLQDSCKLLRAKQVELEASNEQLSAHVEALSEQVRTLGQEPTRPPDRPITTTQKRKR